MILLIGAGSIGKRHLGNLVACGVRDFLVVDPRADRRQEAVLRASQAVEALDDARRSRAPLKIRSASSSEEAYADGARCEAVVIANHPRGHSEEIQRAWRAGAPVFCEKPLATDDEPWEDLQHLVEGVEAAKLLGMVGYNYRFYSQLQQVRRMLAEGAVGRVLSVRGTFSEHLREWHPWEGLNFYMASRAQGGGALLDESHLIDLCRWLFGEIVEVTGANAAISSLKDEPGFETDDLAELVVRFASGAVGSLHMDLFGRHHQKRLDVIGEEGTLFWQFDNTDLESNGIELWKGRRVRLGPDCTRRLPERIIPSDWLTRNHMYQEEVRYFLESVEAGRHLRDDVPDLRDGLRTLAVVRAARRAAASGRWERVEEVAGVPEPQVRSLDSGSDVSRRALARDVAPSSSRGAPHA